MSEGYVRLADGYKFDIKSNTQYQLTSKLMMTRVPYRVSEYKLHTQLDGRNQDIVILICNHVLVDEIVLPEDTRGFHLQSSVGVYGKSAITIQPLVLPDSLEHITLSVYITNISNLDEYMTRGGSILFDATLK